MTEKTKKSKEQEDRSFRIYPFNIIEGDAGEIDIFPQIKPQKTKQEPDTQKLERFIEAEKRVFNMLLENPELITALDKHTTAEIKEILLVDAKKITPPFMGGQMQSLVSKETKDYFKKLEKDLKKEEEGVK